MPDGSIGEAAGMAMESLQERNGGGIRVIARAADVLAAIEREPEGLSLGEIAKEVGLPRSTIQRIVAALSGIGFLIAASPSCRVRLGPAILRLAASTDTDISKIVRPHLLGLSRDVMETVDLAVQQGGSAVFLDQIQGKRWLVAASSIGECFPLHCTATGKAILAQLNDKDADDAISRSVRGHPAHPLRDRAALMAEISDVKRTGLAYDNEEMSAGICAIGTGLRDSFGRAVAVTIPVPTTRFRHQRDSLGKKLLTLRSTLAKDFAQATPT